MTDFLFRCPRCGSERYEGLYQEVDDPVFKMLERATCFQCETPMEIKDEQVKVHGCRIKRDQNS